MLHKQYGSAVRVSPNEVWFDSKEAFAKIYSATQSYDKSDFYLATSLNRPKFDTALKLSVPGSLDLLSERDMDRYRLQRRLIGPLYSMHNIQKFEKAVDDVLAKVVVQLKDINGAELDFKMWMHIIAVECLSAIVLSYSPGYLKAKNDFGSSHHAYLNWRRKSVFGLFRWAVIAESYSKTTGRWFARLWRVTFVTPAPFKPFFTPVYSKITKRIIAALRPKPPKDDRLDLMADLIELHKEKPEFTLTYLKRMAMTNFGAGHETTTSALISAVSMIASKPSVRSRVVSEVQSEAHVHITIAYADARSPTSLPVLGMSPSRTVPVGGLQVHGLCFPPGIRVGCNPVSLQRNPDIFGEDANEYRPERWFNSEATRDMERFNLTWGGGARTCPGRNLAQLILYKVVPVLFKEFDVQITSLPKDEEVKYYFMAMLTEVRARFVPRGSPQGSE
ncbi:putative cytochrome P450 [Septoria linicola]|nr:putative cytochrome P450 [Septoria linicola]